ncbi:MAG: hypothetical protein HWN65_22435 [Candidatus Helarchaeota archaeon]|nr:hypothetical protein [Candidatus Helarchaeota archaeon]
MVWKSKITTEEANELIRIIEENVVKAIMGRFIIESQLFPVTVYIGVACNQLYDQSFQYNIIKNVVDHGGDPREIGRKSKTICGYLNGLGFQTFAMVYLHGRAQCLYDLGGSEHELEEKKEETKFILDFFRYFNPNFRNDRKLLADQSEDENMRVLEDRLIEKLREDILEPSKDQVKQFKRIAATLTTHNFLDKCECRAGIFDHGPYKLDTGELLIFKDFNFLYTGEEIFTGRKAAFEWSETKAKSPIPNISLGYTLKDMKSAKYNDWGTLFADPPDFSRNITGIGMWTRELLPPMEQEYPNKLGQIDPVSWETLEQVGKYCQDALNELYIKMAAWNYNQRCLAGVDVYTNWLALFYAFAGLQEQYDYKIPKRTKSYIPIFKEYPLGVHPFVKRFVRGKKRIAKDPSYYAILE